MHSHEQLLQVNFFRISFYVHVLCFTRISCFVFSVFLRCYCLIISTSAIDCLERLVSEMTY